MTKYPPFLGERAAAFGSNPVDTVVNDRRMCLITLPRATHSEHAAISPQHAGGTINPFTAP